MITACVFFRMILRLTRSTRTVTRLPYPPLVRSKSEVHRDLRQLLDESVRVPAHDQVLDERLGRVLLHPLWGLLVLASVMFVMFQAVYTWAAPLMDAITAAVGALGAWLQAILPAGPLRSLLVDGIVAGIEIGRAQV